MGRGHRPVETVPDHGINIGADVTNNNIISIFLSFCFSGFLSYLA